MCVHEMVLGARILLNDSEFLATIKNLDIFLLIKDGQIVEEIDECSQLKVVLTKSYLVSSFLS